MNYNTLGWGFVCFFLGGGVICLSAITLTVYIEESVVHSRWWGLEGVIGGQRTKPWQAYNHGGIQIQISFTSWLFLFSKLDPHWCMCHPTFNSHCQPLPPHSLIISVGKGGGDEADRFWRLSSNENSIYPICHPCLHPAVSPSRESRSPLVSACPELWEEQEQIHPSTRHSSHSSLS